MFRSYILSILIFLISFNLSAQENISEKINVYIDCNHCDLNYIRDEITFVDYVRDRKLADVHIIMINNTNGSGGQTYEIMFLGQNTFEMKNDTLKFETTSDASDEDVRQDYIRCFKLGLIPYIYKTDIAKNIKLNFSGETENIEKKDKWNNWVFTLGGHAWLNGEKSSNELHLHNNIHIRKVMPNWKTSFYINSNYSESEYNLEEYDYHYSSVNRSFYSEYEYIFGLNEHWSIGGFLYANSSTFSNIKHSFSLRPGIEYNIFEYKDATSKQIRFVYKIGPNFTAYNDTTIFNKIEETLYSTSLSVAAKAVQKWGSISGSITSSTYLHDLSKYHFNFYLNTSVRLFKGLELNISGNYAVVHNQLNLPKGDVTQEELLLEQRQLETQYNFWASIGISYTFGSIYNNIINPRFGF